MVLDNSWVGGRPHTYPSFVRGPAARRFEMHPHGKRFPKRPPSVRTEGAKIDVEIPDVVYIPNTHKKSSYSPSWWTKLPRRRNK